MTDPEPEDSKRQPAAGVASLLAGTRDASWRYLGDRAAADHAYCARFGVTQAPEPYVALGCIWVYALPIVEPPR